MMNWLTAIDLYCERTDPSFWAEPINAITNAAFVLAAIWAWLSARDRGRADLIVLLLCVLAASIGVGSFLFHTYANLWSSFADVIPIWTFVGLYIVVIVQRLTGKLFARVGGIAAAVMAIVVGIVWILSSGSATQTEASTDVFNGSMQYAPAVVAIWVFAILAIRRRLPIRSWVAAAAITFTLSLIARTIDLRVCENIAFGTHFLWHLCNGLMVALLLQALIRVPAR